MIKSEEARDYQKWRELMREVSAEEEGVSPGIYEILPKHFSNLLRVISLFRFTPLEIMPRCSAAGLHFK